MGFFSKFQERVRLFENLWRNRRGNIGRSKYSPQFIENYYSWCNSWYNRLYKVDWQKIIPIIRNKIESEQRAWIELRDGAINWKIKINNPLETRYQNKIWIYHQKIVGKNQSHNKQKLIAQQSNFWTQKQIQGDRR